MVSPKDFGKGINLKRRAPRVERFELRWIRPCLGVSVDATSRVGGTCSKHCPEPAASRKPRDERRPETRIGSAGRDADAALSAGRSLRVCPTSPSPPNGALQ